ncbi:hypothetical protein F441_20401 [Phytophthora nicotianae CJ01A1]|uniref:Chromo domain-containing protein n=2 Tax=Phytophthora nicotianae TaxID=4792 RepID=W2VW62_PHYNI|nr:hypothetical protein F441_20401 [Phytophthora nicotianae CJ01A1]
MHSNRISMWEITCSGQGWAINTKTIASDMDRPIPDYTSGCAFFRGTAPSDGEETDVHTSRLKFYADSSLHITEDIRKHVAAQGQLLAVNELLDYRWNTTKKDYDILVSWKGMEPIKDSWESVKSLAKDILVLLKQFTAGREDSGLDRHPGALMT